LTLSARYPKKHQELRNAAWQIAKGGLNGGVGKSMNRPLSACLRLSPAWKGVFLARARIVGMVWNEILGQVQIGQIVLFKLWQAITLRYRVPPTVCIHCLYALNIRPCITQYELFSVLTQFIRATNIGKGRMFS